MSSGTSLRTIWISIRAMNYTVNVFNDVIRSLNQASMSMNACAIANLNMMKAAVSAGILFGVLAGQIGGIGGKALQFASYIMYATAALQALLAIIKVVNLTNLTMTIPITQTLSIAMWQLAIPIMAAASIFFFFQNSLGTVPALILAICAAVAILIGMLIVMNALGGFGLLSFGALRAGGVSFNDMVVGGKGMAWQMGTRMVGQTGPAILHAGEVIYNPSTGRPTQIGNDLAGAGPSITTIDASMHVDTLNTKASEEQLSDILKRQGRTIAQNNR